MGEAPDPVKLARVGGKGMHVSLAELAEICIAHLTDPACGTVSALARKFDRKRETIAR